jgi:hypothetical protein
VPVCIPVLFNTADGIYGDDLGSAISRFLPGHCFFFRERALISISLRGNLAIVVSTVPNRGHCFIYYIASFRLLMLTLLLAQ